MIKKIIIFFHTKRHWQTSGNCPSEAVINFVRSPWSAESMFKDDNIFAALAIILSEEAVKINLFNRLERNVLLFPSPMLSCCSCFPAEKIAWITATNCIKTIFSSNQCLAYFCSTKMPWNKFVPIIMMKEESKWL